MRFLIAVLVVVFALLQARLWLADGGLREVWRLEDEVARRAEGNAQLAALLAEPRLQRAIGVIYKPETERWSHYFHARLTKQFDAVIHLDQTEAMEPLERTSEWDEGELAETYPSAL